MSDLFAARSQMALSLAFHIVFAAVGMAMPFLMAIAHFRYLCSKDPIFLTITRGWSRGVAIFFATGAVSGTVLSFELGLLWPGFMEHAGAVIGMPFSWEGTAFFLEAIFLGIYLYAWDRIGPWVHWASGVAVGLCGVASALFVVCANGWMNAPAGFDWINDEAHNIDPWAAMFNRAAFGEGIHMVIAAFAATGFAVAGLHAVALLRGKPKELHTAALRIALAVGGLAAIVQPLHGDRLAKQVAILQPTKLAAMESLFHTTRQAPLVVGGLPDEETGTVNYGIHVPRMLSFLAHGDFDAEVRGLDKVPRSDWPPVAVTHVAFQVMVGIGTLLAAVGALGFGFMRWRPTWLMDQRFLWALTLCMPLGFLAIEAGWVVTEVGRQPWIIYGIMRTADAVSPMPGLVIPMAMFTGVYVVLTFVVTWLITRQFRHAL